MGCCFREVVDYPKGELIDMSIVMVMDAQNVKSFALY